MNKFSLEYDEKIRTALQNLSLTELAHIAEVSGVVFYSGYLNRDEDNTREDYIEELSEVSDMKQSQIDRIYKELGI
jgi:hypothetical protein